MPESESSKTLFLLDAYALIFRAYYAFINSRMTNSKGVNTAAIYGFTVALEDVLRTHKPSHIAVVFDPPGGTFRHKMYEPYKANRDETPEAIKVAVPWIKKIIEAWNIPVIEVPGFEADDVIGTLARIAEDKGYLTFMMTPDKDYTQLVTEKRLMFKPGRSGNEAEVIGIQQVKEKYQVEHPSQVIDILALWGDSSDNVPGAPGIGEKGALKLISEYKSIQGLYDNIQALSDKIRNILLNNRELIELSKRLVTIDQYVPLEFDDEKLKMGDYNIQEIIDLYTELGFVSLTQRLKKSMGSENTTAENLREVPKPKGKTPPQTNSPDLFGFSNPAATEIPKDFFTVRNTPHNYHLITSLQDAQELNSHLSKASKICFDTETSSLEIHTTEIVGISFSVQEGEAWFVYLVKDPSLLQVFKPLLENPETLKIGQNLKFDINVLKQYGIQVKGQFFDTMLAHYILQPEERHNMNFLAGKYLKYAPIEITALIGEKGKHQKSMKQIEPERLCEYAAEDADVTFRLYQQLEQELKEQKLENLFYDIEIPLALILADMEATGVRIDTPALNEYAKILTNEAISLEDTIFEMAGERFNISSPKQLGDILFTKLKIASDAKKTKTKQFSTSEETLTELMNEHPIVAHILEYRSCKKLLSTYIEALPALLNPVSGKLHTSYNQAVVATGRLSSTNPNLQNIPIREERGREIRKAFIPSHPEGWIVSADYSQIELRLMAHMSQDPAMIEAFKNNEDIHASTASKIYNVPLQEVSREMRSKAKTANFGIIYGISAFGLSQRLSIPRKEADELIQGYFRSFPSVRQYMNNSILQAREKGYVETLLGRRRFLPEILSGNANIRGMAERNAINAPIQGTAADIIKIAMIHIFAALQKNHLQSKMIMQVHDELVFDVLPEEIHALKSLVKQEMENALTLSVPLTVDIGEGKNWLEAH